MSEKSKADPWDIRIQSESARRHKHTRRDLWALWITSRASDDWGGMFPELFYSYNTAFMRAQQLAESSASDRKIEIRRVKLSWKQELP